MIYHDISDVKPNQTLRAYAHIRRRLLRGELPPGARLVNRALARAAGTSAIPVREAISRLASEGLVEILPGAGAFVRRPAPREIEQLYDLREALEPLAAGEAARNAGASHLAALEALLRDWTGLARTIPPPGSARASRAHMDRWIDHDERFHTIVLDAAGNPWLSRMAASVRLIGQAFAAQRPEPALLTPAVASRTIRNHAALVEAIRRRDVRAARSWMTTQLREGRKLVVAYFRDREPPA